MWIIDRFEGELAILECEDGKHETLQRELLPEGCREGSVLQKKDGVFMLSPALEQERREKLSRMQNDLFN